MQGGKKKHVVGKQGKPKMSFMFPITTSHQTSSFGQFKVGNDDSGIYSFFLSLKGCALPFFHIWLFIFGWVITGRRSLFVSMNPSENRWREPLCYTVHWWWGSMIFVWCHWINCVIFLWYSIIKSSWIWICTSSSFGVPLALGETSLLEEQFSTKALCTAVALHVINYSWFRNSWFFLSVLSGPSFNDSG